jgi:hypothetical protein
VLSVFIAQPVDIHENKCSCRENRSYTDKRIDTRDIHNGKQDHERDDPTTEPPDILGFESLELNCFVDALIYFVDAVGHGIVYVEVCGVVPLPLDGGGALAFTQTGFWLQEYIATHKTAIRKFFLILIFVLKIKKYRRRI